MSRTRDLRGQLLHTVTFLVLCSFNPLHVLSAKQEGDGIANSVYLDEAASHEPSLLDLDSGSPLFAS